MAGLVPAIHVVKRQLGWQDFKRVLHERRHQMSVLGCLHDDVDARDKPGHDDASVIGTPHVLQR
jgi:hypothetical protein